MDCLEYLREPEAQRFVTSERQEEHLLTRGALDDKTRLLQVHRLRNLSVKNRPRWPQATTSGGPEVHDIITTRVLTFDSDTRLRSDGDCFSWKSGKVS